MDINIRKLEPKDIEDIKRIRREIEHVPALAELHEIEESHFVAEIRGQVVGYMLSYISSGIFGIEKSAWISMIGIDPKFMGQGIGKYLAQTALDHYRTLSIKTVYASVSWDSTDILSFFKSLGFDRSAFINLKKNLGDS
jgi:ribosomal protein S18 acetylase RimI-like enzyme